VDIHEKSARGPKTIDCCPSMNGNMSGANVMIWEIFSQKKDCRQNGRFRLRIQQFLKNKMIVTLGSRKSPFLQKNVENYDLNIDPWSYFSLVDRPLVIFFLQIAKKQKQN
jgi:hypothetical protein